MSCASPEAMEALSGSVRLLCDDEKARCLLPGGLGSRVALVLFCDPIQDEASVRRFAGALPGGAPAYVVNALDAPNAARWFGVRETPVLAAVSDGSLLMLETECGPESCARVLAGALDTLRGMSALG
ncbi:MAG: hypothetical protein KDA24_03055 [Deltaproteobacteria bacterium]|nr:hypothetical protein [Deltaproteobacteria bacterium]